MKLSFFIMILVLSVTSVHSEDVTVNMNLNANVYMKAYNSCRQMDDPDNYMEKRITQYLAASTAWVNYSQTVYNLDKDLTKRINMCKENAKVYAAKLGHGME